MDFAFKPIKFGFFLIGFGSPNVAVKIDILKHNLSVLKNITLTHTVDLYIYCYTPEETAPLLAAIDFQSFVSHVHIVAKKGIVGEFIYSEVSKQYAAYDYVVLFLDDIKLPADFHIERLVHVYTEENLHILALPLTPDSPHNYKFMLQMPELHAEGYTYRETNFVELFCYFMSATHFKEKYLPFITKDTKWCWGIDLALHNYGLRMGLLECYPVQHFFKGVSYTANLPSPHQELQVTTAHLRKIKQKINIKRARY